MVILHRNDAETHQRILALSPKFPQCHSHAGLTLSYIVESSIVFLRYDVFQFMPVVTERLFKVPHAFFTLLVQMTSNVFTLILTTPDAIYSISLRPSFHLSPVQLCYTFHSLSMLHCTRGLNVHVNMVLFPLADLLSDLSLPLPCSSLHCWGVGSPDPLPGGSRQLLPMSDAGRTLAGRCRGARRPPLLLPCLACLSRSSTSPVALTPGRPSLCEGKDGPHFSSYQRAPATGFGNTVSDYYCFSLPQQPLPSVADLFPTLQQLAQLLSSSVLLQRAPCIKSPLCVDLEHVPCTSLDVH